MKHLLIASVLAAMAATPASAAEIFKFRLTSMSERQPSFSFEWDKAPAQVSFNATSFTPTASLPTTLSNGTMVFMIPRFRLGSAGGGFSQFSGEQLFTGSLSAPVFRTGTFALFGGAEGVRQIASLEITSTAAAGVPEPDSWALMIVGFGAIGAAMRQRRRRQTVRVTYA